MDEVLQLYDASGRRKYLTRGERARFDAVVVTRPPLKRAFGQMLLHSGCRISEALSLAPGQIDPMLLAVVLRTLKRRKTHFRAVPIPEWLIADVLAFSDPSKVADRIWPWSRTTGWRYIGDVMAEAGIAGPQACPKGLRHGFAVEALSRGVPLTMVQRWLGHASLRSTAVYTEAMGPEERAFAERMWAS